MVDDARNALVDGGWSDPDNRAVLENWYEQQEADAPKTVRAFASAAAAAADAADAADADAVAAADAADAARHLSAVQPKEIDMMPGLKVIQIQVSYYRAITFVGWLRRVAGDEYELLPGARVVARKRGMAYEWGGIDALANDGPGEKYQLTEPMRAKEELHRLGNIRRCKPANVEAWRPWCPQPAEW